MHRIELRTKNLSESEILAVCESSVSRYDSSADAPYVVESYGANSANVNFAAEHSFDFDWNDMSMSSSRSIDVLLQNDSQGPLPMQSIVRTCSAQAAFHGNSGSTTPAVLRRLSSTPRCSIPDLDISDARISLKPRFNLPARFSRLLHGVAWDISRM